MKIWKAERCNFAEPETNRQEISARRIFSVVQPETELTANFNVCALNCIQLTMGLSIFTNNFKE